MRILRSIPLVALLGAGCGSAAVPPQRVAEAESSIRAAEEVGAARYPRSALHLKLARDQLQAARILAEEGEGDDASMALERADADAELSLTLARQARVQAEARRANQRADELQRRAQTE